MEGVETGGNVSVWAMVRLMAPNPSGWGQPGQLSVGHLSPHRVSSQKPLAQKRTIACRQVAQSPTPVPCLSPDPEFAPNLRSSQKGVLGTGGISSSVTTPLPRLSLGSWLKLFLEAAPGALGLASSILRHSKRVFWKKEISNIRVRRSQEHMTFVLWTQETEKLWLHGILESSWSMQ